MGTLKCPEPFELERLAQSDAPLPDLVQEHIIRCDRCRALMLGYREWYDLYEQGDQSQHADNSIELKAINRQEPRPGYRLAASSSHPDRFRVSSFSNEDQGILGRIVHDQTSGDFTLYLMSDDPKKVTAQRVLVKELGFDGLTNDKGQVSFHSQYPVDVESIRIMSPRSTFDLEPHLQKIERQTHSFHLVNDQHDEILIDLSESGEQTQWSISIKKSYTDDQSELTIVALTSQDRHISQKSVHGASIFETDDQERLLKIYLY